MKDLIKGHNPLMLFFVALMSLFFAFAVRNKIVGEGHTDLNANFFFFMVLASCIGVYFLIHEGIKEFTDFFCKKSWKKRGIIPVTETPSATSTKGIPREPEILAPVQTPEPVASATETLSKDDIDQMIADAINAKQNIEIEQKDGSVSFRIDMDAISKSFEGDVERARKAVFTEAVMYTREVLAAHMSAEELGILFDRISRYQRSATNEWPIIESEGNLRRLHPFDPIGKYDLLHYGWNLGQLFGKCNAQTVYFLKTTFDQHFDRMQDRIVSKKLTIEPMKGLIKLNKDFNPNYRYYSMSAKERNLQELAREVEDEDEQRETKGEKEIQNDAVANTLAEKPTAIDPTDESEVQGETLRKLATNGVSHPNSKLATEEREEDSMDFEAHDDEEDMEPGSAEEDNYDSDYDDDNDEDDTDEPASDEFIYAMLARSEARAKNRDIPKAWSPGDPLDLD